MSDKEMSIFVFEAQSIISRCNKEQIHVPVPSFALRKSFYWCIKRGIV